MIPPLTPPLPSPLGGGLRTQPWLPSGLRSLAAGAWLAALGAASPAEAAPSPTDRAEPARVAVRPTSPTARRPSAPAGPAPAVAPPAPAPSGAVASNAAAELQAAELAYTNLEYTSARDAAERVSRQSGLSHDQLVRALRLLALTSAALDRSDAAKDAFVALIAYDPEFELDPKLGPRFQDPYYEAKGYWKAQARRPGVEASTLLRPHAPGVLRVSLSDPTSLAEQVRVGFRWSPAREYVRHRLAAGETQIEVPAPPHGSSRFDYYVQALDRRGNVLFERGSPEAPRSSVVVETGAPPAAAGRSDEGGGLLSKPLFWVATGLVLAGGAAGGYFLLRDEGGAPSAARFSPTLGCGGVRCE